MKLPMNTAPPGSGVSGPITPAQATISGMQSNAFRTSAWIRPVQPSVAERNGFSAYLLGFYLFLLSSLAYEVIAGYSGVQLPIVGVTFGLVLAVSLIAGKPFRFLKSPLLYTWTALMMWWIIAGALGDYPRRSLGYLGLFALRIWLLPFIFCTLLIHLRGIRTVLYGAGLGLPLLLFFCAKLGVIFENRLIIPNTSFGNANDLALHLLLFACFFLVFFQAGKAGRIMAVVILAATLFYILKTGSRAALITLAVMILAAFFLAPGRKRILLVLTLLVVLLAAPFLLPHQTLGRLGTFFSATASNPGEEAFQLQQAADSANARMRLQLRAIQLTLQHPLFGIGPLNFEDAVEKMVRKAEMQKSGWQVAHNSYLQVSSETGLPGLGFYICTILLCLRMNYRSYRLAQSDPQYGDAALQSFGLFLATLSFAVGILFCSIAYDYYLAMLVAFTAATHLSLKERVPVKLAKQSAASLNQPPNLPKRRPVALKPAMGR